MNRPPCQKNHHRWKGPMSPKACSKSEVCPSAAGLARRQRFPPSFESLHETLTLDFPGRAFWQTIDKDNPAWDLELRQGRQQEFAQFERRHRRSRFQNHRRGNVLAKARVGYGERGSLRDGRMALQPVIDFRRRDFLAAPIDHLGFAAMNGEESFRVEA